MNLLWRYLWVIFFSRFESKLDVLDECSTTFRVLPTDVDILLHMNNGRYFSFMDLSRTNYSVRSGLHQRFLKHKIYPVIASEMIRFKKSIDLFQSFEITCRLIGWDEKFIYMIQYFKQKNKIHAMGIIKSCFLHKDGHRVSSNELLNVIDKKDHPPLILPDWVKEWIHADKSFYDEAMTTGKRT
jgi:acyl-CoA thioesterase FadM